MMSSSASWCSSSETHSSAEHSTSGPRPAATAGAPRRSLGTSCGPALPHRSPPRALRWGCADPLGREDSLTRDPPGHQRRCSPRQDPLAGTSGRASRRDSPAHRPASPVAPQHMGRQDPPPAPLTPVLLLQVADLRVLLRQHHVRPQPGRIGSLRRGARTLPRRRGGRSGRLGLTETRGPVRPPRPGPAEARGPPRPRSPARRSPRPLPAWRPRAGAARPTGR